MHPDSQSLEGSFEPMGNAHDAPPAGPAHDAVIEDFNAFFEKLNSLDSLQWSSEPEPGPARPAAPRRNPPARPGGAAPAARAKMTVLKSEALADAPIPAPGAARNRIRASDAARFLKMTVVGLVLFALGLGAGWAALSLPGRFDGSMPAIAQLMERTRATAAPQQAQAPAAERLRVVQATANGPANGATAPRATSTRPAPASGRASTASAAKSAVPAGTAKAPAAPAAQTAAPAQATAAEADGDDAFDTPAPATAADDGIELPVVGADGPANAVAGPRFTLQVGACSSYDCVENYRRLLLRKVSSGAIKVLKQPRGEGAAPIQRIRVEPLGRQAAEQLKSELAALDAHFKDAYLIALH